MATVSQVFIFKPRPGHLEAFIKDLGKLNTVVKRAGGKMRAWNENSGGNPGSIAVVVQHADWKAFGEYRSKFDSDPDFQKLRAEVLGRKDPLADLISTAMSEEVPS